MTKTFVTSNKMRRVLMDSDPLMIPCLSGLVMAGQTKRRKKKFPRTMADGLAFSYTEKREALAPSAMYLNIQRNDPGKLLMLPNKVSKIP